MSFTIAVLFLYIATSFAVADVDTVTCETCLQEQSDTHFWCMADQRCHQKTVGSNNPYGTCVIYESHDLIFNATACCTSKTNFESCTSGRLVSFCEWCPRTTQNRGVCIYKYDKNLETSLCTSAPEVFTECSKFTTCKECTGNILCTWCEDHGTCLPRDSDEHGNPNFHCNSFTTHCCFDWHTCTECSQESGSFDNQACVWCREEQQCKTLEAALSTCTAVNRLGTEYCEDRCYSRSSNCSACVSDRSCIWVSNLKWNQAIGVPTNIESLCTAGSLSGPKSTIVNYKSNSTGRYDYSVVTFYYLNCSLTSSAVISLVIVVVISVVVFVIAVLIIVTILKRVTYAKALKAAREQATDINQAGADGVVDEDSDAAEQREIARLIKPVSWE